MTLGCRISDAFLGVLLNRPGGDNLVWSRRSYFGLDRFRSAAALLWKDTAPRGLERVTQVYRQGPGLAAMASARSLNGPKAWEVDHLYLAGWLRDRSGENSTLPGAAEGMISQLLDGLVQTCAQQGAERVALRCPAGSALVDAARHAGFAPGFRETLLRGQGGPPAQQRKAGAAEAVEPLVVRDRLDQDTFGLFQLYSAATPQQVRIALGFTLDQWRDGQEPGRGRQWVATRRDKVTGWIGRWTHAGVAEGRVMAHPSTPDVTPILVDAALAQPGPHLWQVPEHQEPVRLALLRRGFLETAEIALMVKTVPARRFSRAMAAMEAQG